MNLILLAFLCIFSTSVCEGGNTLAKHTCSKNDQICIKDISTHFIKSIIEGVPEYNITGLDPLYIPSLDHEILDGLVNHYTNITITGMKNVEVLSHHLDAEKSSVNSGLKWNFNFSSDVTTEFKKKSKNYSGTYQSEVEAEVLVQFNFEVAPNDTGEKYFTILQETTTCNTSAEPKVSINNELMQNFQTDLDIKEETNAYMKDVVNHNKRQVCYFAQTVTAKLVELLRQTSKILPAEKYLVDI